MGTQSHLRGQLLFSQWTHFHHSLEPDNLLQCQKEPKSCSNSEPLTSGHTLPKIHFNIIEDPKLRSFKR